MTHPEGTTSAQQPGGLFENIIEVLFAPSKVFDRTRAATAGKYVLVTALLAVAILFATKNLLQPWIDAQGDLAVTQAAAKAAAKGQPFPEEAGATIRRFAGLGFLVGSAFVALLGPYVNGLFLWIGAKVGGAPTLMYGRAAMIAVLAGIPRLLNYIAMPAQAVVLDSQSARALTDLSLGAARFMDPATTSPFVLALVGNIDVTRIWQLVLAAIGVSVVARVSKGAGFVAAIIMVMIPVIFSMLGALFA